MVHALYASGFLYHPPTQQILLQQPSPDTIWSLIGGIYKEDETPEKAFQRITKSILKVHLSLASIHPVYSYVRDDMKRKQCIIYAEIQDQLKATSKKGILFTWFNRKQILKLPLDPQTKQDIIVGHRVIDAKTRERLGQHTL